VVNKIQYEIILYWSQEDQAFIAEVPELPGCAADGATYQEAWQTPRWSSGSGSRRRTSWAARCQSREAG